MKAPDKIYEYFGSDEVIYIRKDALLEWLETELKEACCSSETIGRRNAYIQFIDKLNSL